MDNSVVFEISVVCSSSGTNCLNSLVFYGTNLNKMEDILYFDIQSGDKGKSYTFPKTTLS